MTKKQCTARLNCELSYAMRSYRAGFGLSQEKLAAKMQITPRACSGLENGEYGFSVFSMVTLLSLLPEKDCAELLDRLSAMVAEAHKSRQKK